MVEGDQKNVADAAEMIDEIPFDIAEDGHAPFHATDPGGRPLALAEIETAEVVSSPQSEEQAVVWQGDGVGQAIRKSWSRPET